MHTDISPPSPRARHHRHHSKVLCAPENPASAPLLHKENRYDDGDGAGGDDDGRGVTADKDGGGREATPDEDGGGRGVTTGNESGSAVCRRRCKAVFVFFLPCLPTFTKSWNRCVRDLPKSILLMYLLLHFCCLTCQNMQVARSK